MTVVMPQALSEKTPAAAVPPWEFRPFYATPSFERLRIFENGKFRHRINLDEKLYVRGKTISAYIAIVNKFYGVKTPFVYPFITTIPDENTGLDRHYRINMYPRFIEIRNVGPLKPLTAENQRRLLSNLMDAELWLDLIPPENFEFHGFVILNVVDVTDQEVLSSVKADLIEKESIISITRFNSLRDKLRALLRLPDMMLGLAGMKGDMCLLLDLGRKIGHSFVLTDATRNSCSCITGSLYDRAFKNGEVVIVEDLASYDSRTPIEEEIMKQGIRNMVLCPLYDQKELIGVLELGSPNPGDLNAINVLKLKEVLSLFSMTIKRSMEDLNNQVEAIIKEKCTAIHPSVEWRFRRAALNYIQKQRKDTSSEMEPIVLENVYPLYGMTDVRDSSAHRNAAIRADLIDQLNMARNIILLGRKFRSLPILDELSFRIGKRIEEIETGLGSGDEISVIEFMRRDIERLFEHLSEYDKSVAEKIQAYQDAMDPSHGVLYRRRKDFEESVSLINETINSYIDKEELKAQHMFPHYFEKYKTDGVDHSMYIGASIVENGKFDLLYLKNLRLWQLMMMCGVARETERLRGKLKLPLDAVHLILVQNTPLSLRFRVDEKKFDVDGAYNIRYEIMKKRIDKAVIRGTRERLTQPGKVAIVYSQLKEAAEYRDYIEFLQAPGYLGGEVEDVELEDLQGFQGLKALRVTVNTQAPAVEIAMIREKIEDAVQAMVDNALKN